MRSIFEISTRGMLSARASTEIASNNIANANTPGYTRRTAVLNEHVQKSGTTSTVGLGVNVTQIDRLRNELIDHHVNRKEHEIGELTEKASLYRLMETSLNSTENTGLDSTIGDFFNAFSELSSNPQDLNLRNVLISKAELMADTFRTLDSDLLAFKTQAREGADLKLGKINDLLQEVASINKDIANTRSASQQDNNALDMKTRVLNDLAKLVEFDTQTNNEGATEIRIAGIVVVSGQQASRLRAEVDDDTNAYRVRLPGGKITDAAKGELAASIFMFEEGVPEARQQLDTIASSLIERVNEVHNTGFGIFDGVQRNFFDVTSTNAYNMTINSTLIENPGHIVASSIAGEAGNNDIAIDIASIQSERFIGNQTISTKAIQLMGLAGSKLNDIDVQLESSTAARDFLVERQEQLAGVNIDEELGNLIRFQNSFQASARVLDTGRKMFDTLLSIA